MIRCCLHRRREGGGKRKERSEWTGEKGGEGKGNVPVYLCHNGVPVAGFEYISFFSEGLPDETLREWPFVLVDRLMVQDTLWFCGVADTEVAGIRMDRPYRAAYPAISERIY